MKTLMHIRTKGFTIVELLVVIVVIAILASIAIVSYNGLTRRAVETSIKSDLRSISSVLEFDNARSGSYPASISLANNGQGLITSGENIATYTLRPYGYCVSITNPKTPNSLYIKTSTGKIETGACTYGSTVFSGSTTAGMVNGSAANARFSVTYGGHTSINANGELYISDNGNRIIRKVAKDGTVSTYAGTGADSANDGPIATATISVPGTNYVASDGTLYFRDNFGLIRKVTPAGQVTTVFNYGGGPVGGIAVDDSGTIYLAMSDSNIITKRTAAGVTTTFAGSGTAGYQDGLGTSARLDGPQGLTLDKEGNLYVCDFWNNRIRKITPSGQVTTVAGNGGGWYGEPVNGTVATNVVVASPRGITIDNSGTLYVIGTNDGWVQKIYPSGQVEMLGNTSGTRYNFGETAAIAVDNTTGDIYVTGPHRVSKISQ